MDIVKVIRNEEFYSTARDILALAHKTIDIATYKFEISKRPDAHELNSLIGLLYTLVVVGVDIRVLLNITSKKSGLSRLNENTGRTLKAHGIQVRSLPDDRCQHAKIILVDRWEGIIGSHNWSPKSLVQNFEVSVAIYSAAYLKEIQAHFDKIWAGAKKL